MRLFCLVLWSFLIVFPCYAYTETGKDEDITAGERNTNMYRLSSANSLEIKRLKQIDDVLEKLPNSELYTNHVQIEDLLQDSEKDSVKRELNDLLAKAINLTKDIKDLFVNNSEGYQQIRNIKDSAIKDIQVLNELNFDQKGG